jgi:hypothetical protein
MEELKRACKDCRFGVEEIDNNSCRMVPGGGRVYDVPCISCRLYPKWVQYPMDHYCFQFRKKPKEKRHEA